MSSIPSKTSEICVTMSIVIKIILGLLLTTNCYSKDIVVKSLDIGKYVKIELLKDKKRMFLYPKDKEVKFRILFYILI